MGCGDLSSCRQLNSTVLPVGLPTRSDVFSRSVTELACFGAELNNGRLREQHIAFRCVWSKHSATHCNIDLGGIWKLCLLQIEAWSTPF